MKTIFNPFIDSGYRGPDYFCNREKETNQLKTLVVNHQNTALFAFRRIGKTGLIKHVFDSLKKDKNRVCIYLDILGTIDKSSFINQLATAIYNTLPNENSMGKRIIKAIQSLRPVIEFDPLSGQPSLSINSSTTQQQESSIASLFSFIDQQKIQIVIAIDEFQQILAYPEKNMEALLRTQMQNLKNTSFIFCGSNQRMMHEIFNSAKRPFFASCTFMHLDIIPQKEYVDFIVDIFKKHDRNIEPDTVKFICEWTMLHTFYTQYFCNTLYSKNISNINLDHVQNTASEILNLQEGKFYQYRNLITTTQWNLLTAIAKEQRLFKPHAKDFMTKYKLGSSSIIGRTMEALLSKELIMKNTSVDKPYFEVYDKFLMRWLQSK